jgi:hypothetical protein
MPFWAPVFEEINWDIRAVLEFRSPLEVALSLNRRDSDIPLALGCLIWLRHVLDAEAHSRNLRRTVVDWRLLLAQKSWTLEYIATELGLNLQFGSGDSVTEIEEFLSEDMRHHSVSYELLRSHPSVGAFVRETYETYLDLAADPTDPTVWRRLDDLRERLDVGTEIFDRWDQGRHVGRVAMATRRRSRSIARPPSK